MALGGYQRALIVGAGAGLSASLARALTAAGLSVGLAARRPDKLADICVATRARSYKCDASDPASVDALFAAFAAEGGDADVVIYNASGRTRGDFETLAPDAVRDAIAVSAFGGFLVGQAAVKRMLPMGCGAVLFTGASASLKGFPRSAAFAMGKFALRGLAQSMARELGPKGIHVAHVVIDGGIRSAARHEDPQRPDALLDPDAIAESYLALLRQPRSAWTSELELRPWVETF